MPPSTKTEGGAVVCRHCNRVLTFNFMERPSGDCDCRKTKDLPKDEGSVTTIREVARTAARKSYSWANKKDADFVADQVLAAVAEWLTTDEPRLTVAAALDNGHGSPEDEMGAAEASLEDLASLLCASVGGSLGAETETKGE